MNAERCFLSFLFRYCYCPPYASSSYWYEYTAVYKGSCGRAAEIQFSTGWLDLPFFGSFGIDVSCNPPVLATNCLELELIILMIILTIRNVRIHCSKIVAMGHESKG